MTPERQAQVTEALGLMARGAFLLAGHGPGNPLESPYCLSVGDFTVDPYYRRGDTWSGHKSDDSIDAWCWTPDDGDGDDDVFFIDGPHDQPPPVPADAVAYEVDGTAHA